MNTARLQSRSSARNRRRQPESTPAWGLPPHPFRYALVATLGVGVGTAILGGIGALGTVLVYLGIAFFLAIAVVTAMCKEGFEYMCDSKMAEKAKSKSECEEGETKGKWDEKTKKCSC